VILHGSHVGEHCKLKRVIVDSSCRIPAGLSIGYDREQDIENGFRVTEKGITLVTSKMLKALAKKTD
jgi:glucose-1-phosphate adenylyltransferase